MSSIFIELTKIRNWFSRQASLDSSWLLIWTGTVHIFLDEELCFFDGKFKRVKGWTSLTASVYHPLLRRQKALATMECSGESLENVSEFWAIINQALSDYKGTIYFQSTGMDIFDHIFSIHWDGLPTTVGLSPLVSKKYLEVARCQELYPVSSTLKILL